MQDKPWVWTSLGTAAMIVLCCGISPVAIIAGIESIRESETGTGGGGAVVARASQHPAPRSSSPLAAAPSTTPSPLSSLTPSPFPLVTLSPIPAPEPFPQEPPPAADPLPAEPEYQAAPAPPVEPVYPAPPQTPSLPEPVPPPPVQGITLPLPVESARIGDVVRTGGLEFVVRGVRCGLKQVGTETRGQQAVGQFCVVSLSIRNIGELIQNALDTGQTAIGANGSVYGIDSLASLIANEVGNLAFLSGIAPGQEVSGVVVFDLPDGIDLTQVVLPGGIKVDTR